MSLALQRAWARMNGQNGGMPVIGNFSNLNNLGNYEEFGIDELGRIVPLARRGAQGVRRFVAARRQHRCGGEGMGYDVGGAFGLDDEMGALDQLEADDDEIEWLGNAPEQESLAGIDDRIEKLDAKIFKKQQQLSVETRPRVQRKLQRQLENALEKRSKLQARANRRAARKGEPIRYGAAAAGGAAAGAAAGFAAGAAMNNRNEVMLYDSRGQPVLVPGVANIANNDVNGIYLGTQPAKREIRLPLFFTGALKARNKWTGNASAITPAGDVVSWECETQSIPFAEVEVIGLEVETWVNGTQGTSGNLLPNLQASIVAKTFLARGSANLFLGDQTITTGNATGSSNTKNRLEGLRDNPIIRATNTISASGTMENVFNLAASATEFLEVVIAVSAICNIRDDDQYPSPRRLG